MPIELVVYLPNAPTLNEWLYLAFRTEFGYCYKLSAFISVIRFL